MKKSVLSKHYARENAKWKLYQSCHSLATCAGL